MNNKKVYVFKARTTSSTPQGAINKLLQLSANEKTNYTIFVSQS